MDDEALMGGESLVDDGCPMDCGTCQAPGDCEDCLDCLYWPEDPDDHSVPPGPPRGPSVPTLARELAQARAQLHLGRRVGLVLRRFRRMHALSQRGLARDVGWSRSSLARAEVDASAQTLRAVDELLRHTGHRLAIIADAGPETGRVGIPDLGEDPDHAWGVTDLVARDARGRRLPPVDDVLYRSPSDRRVGGCHEEPWIWRRSRFTPPLA